MNNRICLLTPTTQLPHHKDGGVRNYDYRGFIPLELLRSYTPKQPIIWGGQIVVVVFEDSPDLLPKWAEGSALVNIRYNNDTIEARFRDRYLTYFGDQK